MRRSPFLLALLLVLSATPAGAGAPDVQQVMALGAACEDTARADSAFHALGQVIATTTDSFPIAYCHYLRFRAARTLGRLDAMQASADTAVLFAPDNPRPFLELARTFAARDVRLGVAEDYARRAVETAARGHDSHLSGWSLAVLGIVQVARHDEAHAVDALRRSLSFAYADSQKTFLLLGKVCSTLGQRGPALDAYLRGVAVYRGDSTRVREARPVLDSLYRAEHGSLEGLASLVRRAREA